MKPSMAGERRRRRRRRMLVCGNVHDNKKKGPALATIFFPHTQYSKILKLKAERLQDGRGEKTQREAGVGWMETKKGEACMRF